MLTKTPVEDLIKKIKTYNPLVDTDLINRAYEFANKLHSKQYRDSGEIFITHPLEVANICADLGLDTVTIAAALLHDVIEDTPASLSQVKKEFGEEIATLVDGVTKLEKLKFRVEEEQAENLRKMLVAMAKDIRVILIKLADRLHNMRTADHIHPEKQKEKAEETLEIYAPLAHRLGISQLKSELEDLSFAILEPKRYAQVRKLVAETKEAREAYLKEVINALSKELEKVGIKGEIVGRAKHFYSIYQKMKQRGKDFNEIHDLSAVRIIVDTVKDCYASLGVVHTLWKPIPGRFKDYIAMPKFNMYQTLHTSVIGPQGKQLEVQIRTKEMHRIAEFGIAAHWRYKEGMKEPNKFEERLAWLAQMLEWESELKDPREFMKALKIDLFEDEVFVFTPKGDVISLPVGSSPVDFAYAIHTEVGHSCVGAKVNNAIVPLDYKLQMGDIVEIMTSKSASGPSRDWLYFTRTSRARNKIRQWFSKEVREDSINLGKEALQKILRKHGLSLKVSLDSSLLNSIAKEFNFAHSDDLYASIGAGNISPKQVVTKIIQSLSDRERLAKPTVAKHRPKKVVSAGVRVKGVEDILIRLARCCNPVPYDEIIGFVTQGRGVSVHRKDCHNVQDFLLFPDRLVEVVWDIKKPGTFTIEIRVEAIDRTKLLRDVSTVISDAGVNILSANVTTTKDGLAFLRFVFEIGNLSLLDKILEEVKKVDSVFDAYRVLPS